MQLFSAVGKKKDWKDSHFTVEAGGEEYVLVSMEIYLWSSLLWNFVEQEVVMEHVLGLTGQVKKQDLNVILERRVKESEIQFCLNRLLLRGLVVSGEGDTVGAAISDLLMKVYVAPNQLTRTIRLGVVRLAIAQGLPVHGAFTGLRKNKNERLLLEKLMACGDLSAQLKDLNGVLEEQASWAFRLLPEYRELQETVKLDFFTSVVLLYHKKLLIIQGITQEVEKEVLCL
ncbi:MAG: hypothetical protein LBT06_07500 [Hungatella sp.]|jgi:hypothetical protein|nr:hypothetical protein [Hungatella sp.]